MPPTNAVNAQSMCPCTSHQRLADCCLPYISGVRAALTAEQLMRSRYTAHVLLAIDYLWDTWDAQERITSSKEEIRAWAESCEWMELSILSTSAGQEHDAEGVVAFVASYRQHGKLQQHHEISLFRKLENHWRYVSHCN